MKTNVEVQTQFGELNKTKISLLRGELDEGIRGIPLRVELRFENLTTPHYVYLWHCSPSGQYSSLQESETYLRGIQMNNERGMVDFKTIYPGWHSNRAVHLNIEVYKNLCEHTPIYKDQLAFPMGINNAVQSTRLYKGTAGMQANSSDDIFKDGTTNQILTLTGSISAGYVSSICLRLV